MIDTPPLYSEFLHVWRTMRDKEYFVFQVQACSDAHVAFSATNGIDSSQWYYDLTICGWINSQTILRKRSRNGNEDVSEAFSCPQLLKVSALCTSDGIYNHFVLSAYTNNKLALFIKEMLKHRNNLNTFWCLKN